MKTIEEIRKMSDTEILAAMKTIAQNMVGVGTVDQVREQAMYYTVMAQRKNVDPRPKIKAAGYGIYDQALNEEWF